MSTNVPVNSSRLHVKPEYEEQLIVNPTAGWGPLIICFLMGLMGDLRLL